MLVTVVSEHNSIRLGTAPDVISAMARTLSPASDFGADCMGQTLLCGIWGPGHVFQGFAKVTVDDRLVPKNYKPNPFYTCSQGCSEAAPKSKHAKGKHVQFVERRQRVAKGFYFTASDAGRKDGPEHSRRPRLNTALGAIYFERRQDCGGGQSTKQRLYRKRRRLAVRTRWLLNGRRPEVRRHESSYNPLKRGRGQGKQW